MRARAAEADGSGFAESFSLKPTGSLGNEKPKDRIWLLRPFNRSFAPEASEAVDALLKPPETVI